MGPANDRMLKQSLKGEIEWFLGTYEFYIGQQSPSSDAVAVKDSEETSRVRKNYLNASLEEKGHMLESGKYDILLTILIGVLKEVLGAPKQPLPTFEHYHKVGALLMSVGFRDAFNRWITESRGYNKDRQHQKERMFDLLDKSIDSSMDLFDDDCDDYVKEHLRGSDDFQIPPPRTYHTRGRRTKQLPPLRKKTAIKRNGQQRWGQNAQRRTLRY